MVLNSGDVTTTHSTISKIAQKFEIQGGFLRNLATSTSGLAGMVQTFCSKIGQGNVAMLLAGSEDRLLFGMDFQSEMLIDKASELIYWTCRRCSMSKELQHGYFGKVDWGNIGAVAESDTSDILPLLIKVPNCLTGL